MSERPLFSICHTTARPEGWQQSFGAWCALMSSQCRAEYLGGVEYVLCIDRRWGFTPAMMAEYRAFARSQYPNVDFKVVWNNGRKCMVDGYAFAAAASTGAILILNSDDMFPPKDWDLTLEAWSCRGPQDHGYQPDFVIQVSSDTPADARDLMVLQILSRARYERLGYALYPGYESMFADDDFSEHARHDGVVIDARHLLFEHRHPASASFDTVYKHQNRSMAYEIGICTLTRRRANGFEDVAAGPTKIIASCTPGESFNAAWVSTWHELQGQILSHGLGLDAWWGHCSNVYVTRSMMIEPLMPHLDQYAYVLWIDDDNLVEWSHLSKLIEDLETYPDISMVVGWCYIQPDLWSNENAPKVHSSVGNWVNDRFKPVSISTLEESDRLIEIDCSGFPVVLMRSDALKLAGELPFNPRIGPQYERGMTGEDISFCLNLRERGGKIMVDPRVRVDHLKTRPVEYIRRETILPEAGQFETKGVLT
jgi:hypothetical protein